MSTGLTYLESLQKLFETAKMTVPLGEKGVKTKPRYRYPKEESADNDMTAVYEYLGKRGISKTTIDMAGIRADTQGNIAFNFYDANDVLTLVKYRPARKVQKGEIKCWCQKDADTTPLLFNMNKVNTSEPLVLVEGEIDCLAAIEAGYLNAVSVPLGAGNFHWIEENFDWLEQFESIIICADNDEAGLKMQKECLYRLGSWRTKFIEIPKFHEYEDGRKVPMKDLNHVLYYQGKQAVLNLIHNAKDPGVPSVVDISDVDDLDLDEMDGVKTGIRPLDAELMKLFFGTLTVLTGLPGSGKTSFLCQLACQALDQETNIWMFSREMPNRMTRSWWNYIAAGGHHVKQYQNSEGSSYYKVTQDAKEEIGAFYQGRLFLYKDDASNKFDDILKSMADCVRKYGTRLLILDNLMTIDLDSSEENEKQKQTECINKLIYFAMKYSVAILLVAHPRKTQRGVELDMHDVSGTANIVNLAHRTFTMQRINDESGQSQYDVSLRIVKDRMCGKKGKKIDMYYDVPTRRFYTNDAEYNHQYIWDKQHHSKLPYPHPEEYEVYGQIKGEH